jgi:hypothetical protein
LRNASRNFRHLAQGRASFGESARDLDNEQHSHQSAFAGNACLVLGYAAVIANGYIFHLMITATCEFTRG